MSDKRPERGTPELDRAEKHAEHSLTITGVNASPAMERAMRDLAYANVCALVGIGRQLERIADALENIEGRG